MAKNDTETRNQEQGCPFCTPDENSNYELFEFKNPENNQENATISLYGGEINVLFDRGELTPSIRLRVAINHCPRCGRKVRKEAIK